jgi:hypothetical protein
MCDQCNSTDGAVKLHFGNIRADFSYSPSEIREVVSATPHSSHKIDFQKARLIYDRWLGGQALTPEG